MALPAALVAATLNGAVATLPVYHHRTGVSPNADTLLAAQNLVAALIATGLVDSPNIIINGAIVNVTPPANPVALKYNDTPPGPTVLINPATDI